MFRSTEIYYKVDILSIFNFIKPNSTESLFLLEVFASIFLSPSEPSLYYP